MHTFQSYISKTNWQRSKRVAYVIGVYLKKDLTDHFYEASRTLYPNISRKQVRKQIKLNFSRTRYNVQLNIHENSLNYTVRLTATNIDTGYLPDALTRH